MSTLLRRCCPLGTSSAPPSCCSCPHRGHSVFICSERKGCTQHLFFCKLCFLCVYVASASTSDRKITEFFRKSAGVTTFQATSRMTTTCHPGNIKKIVIGQAVLVLTKTVLAKKEKRMWQSTSAGHFKHYVWVLGFFFFFLSHYDGSLLFFIFFFWMTMGRSFHKPLASTFLTRENKANVIWKGLSLAKLCYQQVTFSKSKKNRNRQSLFSSHTTLFVEC